MESPISLVLNGNDQYVNNTNSDNLIMPKTPVLGFRSLTTNNNLSDLSDLSLLDQDEYYDNPNIYELDSHNTSYSNINSNIIILINNNTTNKQTNSFYWVNTIEISYRNSNLEFNSRNNKSR